MAANAHVFNHENGQPRRLELVANCMSEGGRWALAVSHNAADWSTAAYWSLDHRFDGDSFVQEMQRLQGYASHPALLPCIMFAETLRRAVQRRNSIKERLVYLESQLSELAKQVGSSGSDGQYGPPRGLGRLFELVQSCRDDQSSREGRYDFWTSLHEAIEEGFRYVHAVLRNAPDSHRFKLNADLEHWSAMIWQRLRSLMASDRDHIQRVSNAAITVSQSNISE